MDKCICCEREFSLYDKAKMGENTNLCFTCCDIRNEQTGNEIQVGTKSLKHSLMNDLKHSQNDEEREVNQYSLKVFKFFHNHEKVAQIKVQGKS